MKAPARLLCVRAHLEELYRSRALVANLVQREVAARYKRSVLGFLWTLLTPLMSLAVYWVVFTKVAASISVPNYAVFLFAGLLPWTWLSSSVLSGATSITTGGALITRICLPPQVLPAVTVLTQMVHFLLSIPIAFLAALACGVRPGAELLLLPVLVLVLLGFTYGFAVLLAAITVRFRDVPFIVQNTVPLWFFLTPIAYPLDTIPAGLRWLYRANPATGLILPFVDVLYRSRLPDPLMLATSIVWTCGLLVAGVLVFEALRNSFAQEI